ncbi:hypothetical protein BCU75_17730 [Vibrio splendidus]|nr:hypothetical protein BCU75_17730 [Vibrio splendidus]
MDSLKHLNYPAAKRKLIAIPEGKLTLLVCLFACLLVCLFAELNFLFERFSGLIEKPGRD